MFLPFVTTCVMLLRDSEIHTVWYCHSGNRENPNSFLASTFFCLYPCGVSLSERIIGLSVPHWCPQTSTQTVSPWPGLLRAWGPGRDGISHSPVHIVAPSKVVLLVHITGLPTNHIDYTVNRLWGPNSVFSQYKSLVQCIRFASCRNYLHLFIREDEEPTKNNPKTTRLESWLF